MKALSASEAVWPALKRSFRLLFQPFDLERFLPVAALAVLSEGVLLSLRLTAAEPNASDTRQMILDLPRRLANLDFARLFAPEWIVFTLLGVAVAVFLFFLALYLSVLCRFVFFRTVVSGELPRRAVWARCEAPAWRLFKGYLFLGLVLILLAVGWVALIVVAVTTLFTLRSPEGKLDAGVFLLLFFPCMAAILLVVLLAVMSEVALHDFVLPVMALEDKPFVLAWKEVRHRIWVEKDAFFSYFLVRAGLPLLAGFILAVAAWYPIKGVFLLLGISAQGFAEMLEDTTGIAAWLHVLLQALFRLVEALLGLAAAFVLGSPLSAWIRAYAVDFYAGRYKPLAEALHGAGEARLDTVSAPAAPSSQTA